MLRLGRSLWAMIVFLLGFTILITILSHYFLIPALPATNNATPAEKGHIQAVATLLLAVVLFVLSVGLILVLRVKRFFVSSSPDRQKTEYVDAWAEAGKRVTPDAPEQE